MIIEYISRKQTNKTLDLVVIRIHILIKEFALLVKVGLETGSSNDLCCLSKVVFSPITVQQEVRV